MTASFFVSCLTGNCLQDVILLINLRFFLQVAYLTLYLQTFFNSILHDFPYSKFSVRRSFRQIGVICLLLTVLSGRPTLCAQWQEKMYMADSKIDTTKKGQLSVAVENLTFFRDNEYNSSVQKGYTLPGFWLQLKAVYHPLSNIKLEAGAHSIWFWGASRYPAYTYYQEIATWKGEKESHAVHVLPLLRAHIVLSDRWSFIIGNLYGGANHRLIEPLYNPELNLSSDPETGVQLLYTSDRIIFDVWLNWMTFIYRLDTHQESFASGASAQFYLTQPESALQVYVPLQGLIHHRGGEIEAFDENIQTLMNGVVGAGIEWRPQSRVLRSVKTEFDITGHYFPKGRTYQSETGMGYYLNTAMQLKDFTVSASYWRGRNFIPVFGSVFYSAVSLKKDRMMYENPGLLHFGADYVRSLGKGFALGAKFEVFRYVSGKMYAADTRIYQPSAFGKNANYAFEICFRMTPTFSIKNRPRINTN